MFLFQLYNDMIIIYYLSKYVQHNTICKYILIRQREVQYIFFLTYLLMKQLGMCLYLIK